MKLLHQVSKGQHESKEDGVGPACALSPNYLASMPEHLSISDLL